MRRPITLRNHIPKKTSIFLTRGAYVRPLHHLYGYVTAAAACSELAHAMTETIEFVDVVELRAALRQTTVANFHDDHRPSYP